MLQEYIARDSVFVFDSKVTFLGWSLQILVGFLVGCRRLWVTVQFLQITWSLYTYSAFQKSSS